MKDIVLNPFRETGINEVYINEVVKNWNHLWFIAEWKRDDSWRLIKCLRKDSPITSIKLTISNIQAKELIEKLNLISENSGFKSSFSWRREKDTEYLENWRREKFNKNK